MTRMAMGGVIRATAALGAAIVLSAAAVPTAQAQGAPVFKIGAVCSLTGPAAGFGKPYCDGFAAYVRYWNSRGGAAGKKVDLAMLDDETNTIAAVNAFRRHTGDRDIQAIWFGMSSNSVMAIKPLAAESKVPIVSGGAADAIGVPADPYLFKVAPGAIAFMTALLDFAAQHGARTIASLHATDTFGQAELAWIKELAPKRGIKVVAQETFANADTNFTAQLVRVRAARPDLVYSGASAAPAVLIFKQYRELGLKAPLALNQAGLNQAFLKAIGDPALAEGLLTPTNQGNLGAAIGGEAGKQFELLEKWLGRPAMVFDTFGWDHGIITEWAVVNSDGSREGIRAALDRAREVDGINGPFNFTPGNHIGQDARGLRVAVMRGGKLVKADKLPTAP